MKRIKFDELKHMDMIYYVRGKVEGGKVHIVSETRFVHNPKPEEGFVWTYKMTPGAGNDPCIKIKKEHIAICVSRGKYADKHTAYLRSEFKRLFVYDKFATADSKDGECHVTGQKIKDERRIK